MQNYEQILQELGIEVPEEKKAELKKKISENYRTKADYDKAVEKRDEYKKSLDDVQEKLDGFKDINVDDLKTQISTLTTDLANEKAARAADGEKKYEFLNDITEEHYRTALLEELEKDSAKGKSIEEIFNRMITDNDGKQKTGIFVDKKQQKAQQQAARFTTPGTGRTTEPGAKLSMGELMKMKNENPGLDITQYM